ncbi:unnamed protein product [Protopolystoma xenopodis]|uniref:Uncharacterized protein n=1 Tax=Protopolystoma xenopodis TaxID=117903 RepID=A0A3S4ZFK6_9PLAT|nr:unnamed protein product [Protopolystoma xenopodis]
MPPSCTHMSCQRITLRLVGQLIEELIGSGYQHPYCVKSESLYQGSSINLVASSIPAILASGSGTALHAGFNYGALKSVS